MIRPLRILGVDPGSRLTGYGCVDVGGSSLTAITHGTLRLSNTSGKADIPLEQRLLSLYEGLTQVIRDHRPDVLVIEKVFFAKNAVSALKLGQARGAAILTGMIHGMKIAEYSPSEVKQALVGHGQADKDQVARMVQLILGQQIFSSSDASDALALAVCHAHAASRGDASRNLTRSSNQDHVARALHSASGRRSKKRQSLAESLGLGGESPKRTRR